MTSYLEGIRNLTNTTGNPDWTTGVSSEAAARAARNTSIAPAIPGEHAAHLAQLTGNGPAGISFAVIDRIMATVSPLHLAYPVLISRPRKMGEPWTAKSDAQNRTLRVDLELNPATGAIVKRENFNQRQWIDRAVGIGVAAHEGQLFGLPNQLLGALTAMGLILLSISSVVLWWRRRPENVLGAPPILPLNQKLSATFIAMVVVLAVCLPLLGLSIIAVRLVEILLLRRSLAARQRLGLQGI
jgi:uncharacterized iron-regulated membrane protein